MKLLLLTQSKSEEKLFLSLAVFVQTSTYDMKKAQAKF